MSKVLISFIGTGNAKNKDQSERTYRDADYTFEDGQHYKTSFIADALSQHYGIGKLILVGTVKSMWERVYEVFCEKQSIEKDEDYWLKLAYHCDYANAKSVLEIPEQKKLEDAIGKDSHIELIKYGLNQVELEENANIILGLEKYMQKGDELYLDITHSFRSLPVYLMNLIIYLKNVSEKKIVIKNISYGMLDVQSELGFTPVVNLSSVMEIHDWMIGAYSFQQFGNGYKIAELMKAQDENNMHNRLTKFSDLLNLNHLDGIKKQTQELSSIKKERHGAIADLVIPGVVDSFIQNFPGDIKQSTFQLRLAKWHSDHCNFSSAYITIVEAIITFVCEELQIDCNDYNNREMAKDVFRNKQDLARQHVKEIDTLSKVYFQVKNTRNSVAHSIESVSNYKDMIKNLKSAITTLNSIING